MMDLKEVLNESNNGEIFICKDNDAKVKNDGRTLLFLYKNIDDGTETWKEAFISHVWVESEYILLENN